MSTIKKTYKKYIKEILSSPYGMKSKWILMDRLLLNNYLLGTNNTFILEDNNYIRKKISLFYCLKEIYDLIGYRPAIVIKNPSIEVSNYYINKSKEILTSKANISSLEEICKDISTQDKIYNKIIETSLDILLIEEPIRESTSRVANKKLIRLFLTYKKIKNDIIESTN